MSTIRSPRPLSVLIFFCLSVFIFQQCGSRQQDRLAAFADTSARIYGPYQVYKLPVTKGVKVLNPVQVNVGPQGKIFACNQSGEVYYLIDSDKDGLEDEGVLYANVTELGLSSPVGFASRGDTIFVGTSSEIRVFVDRNADLRPDTNWTFFSDIPYSKHPYEWTTGMTFGPDGWLYFNLTTDSWNAAAPPDPKGYRGAILRISPDGKIVERLATGIRSVYGMQFNEYGDMFFSDNEGGGNPKEELNLLVPHKFYGHNRKKYPNEDSTAPVAFALTNDVAPSGMEFNRKDNDFGNAGGELFVAWYGPGERWNRGGISRVRIVRQNDGKYSYEEKAVVDIPKLSDLCFGIDGSLYASHHGQSDYWYNPTQEKSGGFFKIVYDPLLKGKTFAKKERMNSKDLSPNSIEAGKQLFARNACAACHATDGRTEMLGPNLHGIANTMTRDEILDDIMYPSKRIKPAQTGLKVTKKNGQVLMGRLISNDEKQLTLILVGNATVTIDKADVLATEEMKKSMMYENLISRLTKQEVDNLMDYIVSLK